MRIIKRKRFLALQRCTTAPATKFACYFRSESELISAWGLNTRSSPIWPVISTEKSDDEHKDDLAKNGHLIFIGPLNPVSLDIQFGPNFTEAFPFSSVWVSLGLYNLVVSTSSRSEKEKLIELCRDIKVSYEIWELKEGRVEGVSLSELESENIACEKYQAMRNTDNAVLDSKLFEFKTTALSTELRASNYLEWVQKDIRTLTESVLNLVESRRSPEGEIAAADEGELVYALANANSGLARFLGQTFSGTSPIEATECQYWPHSLLGTGLSNTALRNTIFFVEQTLGRFDVINRFLGLESIMVNGRKNPDINDKNDVNNDYLKDIDPHQAQKRRNVDVENVEDVLVTPISFFSGRDNFKNDVYTVSVPLDTISGLNSKRWSLLTVTHELSHRFIEPIISEIVPLSASDTVCNVTSEPVYSKKRHLENKLDCAKHDFIKCLLAYAEACGYPVSDRKKNSSNSEWLLKVVHDYHVMIEEIFVHCFDFLYFYERKPKAYIQGIWNSWGVLPHIETKIDEYVIRTIAALCSNKITVNDPVKIAREEFLIHLPSSGAAYMDKAREIVVDDDYWEHNLLPKIHAAEFSSRFVRMYLYSDAVMKSIGGEGSIKGSKKYDYDYSDLVFDSKKFENPLKFLTVYTTDDEPNEMKSLWIFTMLGLALEPKVGH